MTAINFPANPSVDDTHVVGDITWRWNGSSWVSSSTFNGRMPAGTTDQRPTEPKIGMIRYNTDLDTFEGYDGEKWVYLEQYPDEAIFPPDTLGQSFRGGIYMGTIAAAGTCYYLIVAPNATGCACCQWKTTRTTTAGTTSCVDGYANTYGPMDNSTHPAGNWCATRTINGFSDWYLPAIDELDLFYNNGATGSSEAVIGPGEAFASINYWSSTENLSTNACYLNFCNGNRNDAIKNSSHRVRAVRREPI